MNSKESTDTLILPSLLLQIPESAQQKLTSSLLWTLKSRQKAVVLGKKRMPKVPKEPKQSKFRNHSHYTISAKNDSCKTKKGEAAEVHEWSTSIFPFFFPCRIQYNPSDLWHTSSNFQKKKNISICSRAASQMHNWKSIQDDFKTGNIGILPQDHRESPHLVNSTIDSRRWTEELFTPLYTYVVLFNESIWGRYV